MNETFILLLLSVPYYVDLVAGIFTFRFIKEIMELDEEREKP
jgi:hypothetical protein